MFKTSRFVKGQYNKETVVFDPKAVSLFNFVS